MNELILNRRSGGLFAAGEQSSQATRPAGWDRPPAGAGRTRGGETATPPAQGRGPVPVLNCMGTAAPIKITN